MVLSLKDSDSKFRQIVQSLCSTDEACEIKNDQGQTVAVLLPTKRYASYQTYLRQKAEDFAVFDRILEEKMTDPVFIVSTGRRGSTMLSNMVKLHPDLLSVSEFFTALTSRVFRGRRPTGETVFRRLNTLSPGGKALLTNGLIVDEFLYPIGPEARYALGDVPSIMCTTLPHLTDDPEGLWDDFAAALRVRGKRQGGEEPRADDLLARNAHEIPVHPGGTPSSCSNSATSGLGGLSMDSMPFLSALDSIPNPSPCGSFSKWRMRSSAMGSPKRRCFKYGSSALPYRYLAAAIRSAESGGKGEVSGNVPFCFSRDLKNMAFIRRPITSARFDR